MPVGPAFQVGLILNYFPCMRGVFGKRNLHISLEFVNFVLKLVGSFGTNTHSGKLFQLLAQTTHSGKLFQLLVTRSPKVCFLRLSFPNLFDSFMLLPLILLHAVSSIFVVQYFIDLCHVSPFSPEVH
jgi:hypothetical protein